MTNTVVRKLQALRTLSNHSQYKISALILQRGRPISFGFNDQTKTHPEIRKYSEVKTMHAEMAAIFKMKNQENLKGCTMVVYREDRFGNLAMSKPCSVCEKILKFYGITNIIYTTASGWKEESI